MIPTAQVQVNIDNDAIRSYIEQQLKKQINQQILLVDINKLSELTSISPRYLEDHILMDPRVKQFERKKQRKRWWIWDNDGVGVKNSIINIVNDW